MKAAILGLAVAALAASFVTERASQETLDLDARIDAIVEEALADGADGFAIAVDVGGQEYLARGWGQADPGTREEAGPDSAVRAGSLTAPLLSIAVLQLVDQEKLALDAPVNEVLDAFPYEEEAITVEHLLTHTSGLPSYGDLLAGDDIDPDAIWSWLKEEPLDAAPGECHELSPTNTLLLGWILEEVSGRSVPDYLGENVFAIASMDSTRYCDDGPNIREQARFTQEFAGSDEDLSDVPQPFDAARLCTSARDLVRWQRALVERTLISNRSYDHLTQAAELKTGERVPFSHGLNLTPLGDLPCVSVGGSAHGGSTHVAFYPEMDLTIAVVAIGELAGVRNVERRIARAFHRLPELGVQDVRLEPEARQHYVGAYFVGCTEYRIEEAGEFLTLQPPAGPTLRLLYQGEQRFVAELDAEIQLRFEMDEGQVLGFELDEHGATSRAKRLK